MPWLWSSMGWISHLNKLQFLIVSRKKSQELFPKDTFLLRVVHDYLSKCPNSKKTPLPQVTRLGWLLLLISFALVNIYLYIEQKQLSSHTKIKKKSRRRFAPSFFAHFKSQTTRKTDDELGFIVQHKLNQIKCLNIQITTARILNSFRPTSHIAVKAKLIPPRWVAKTLQFQYNLELKHS